MPLYVPFFQSSLYLFSSSFSFSSFYFVCAFVCVCVCTAPAIMHEQLYVHYIPWRKMFTKLFMFIRNSVWLPRLPCVLSSIENVFVYANIFIYFSGWQVMRILSYFADVFFFLFLSADTFISGVILFSMIIRVTYEQWRHCPRRRSGTEVGPFRSFISTSSALHFFFPRVVISCDDALHFRVASIGSRVTIKASLLSWASEAGAWAWGEGGGASPKPARVARPMQLEVE